VTKSHGHLISNGDDPTEKTKMSLLAIADQHLQTLKKEILATQQATFFVGAHYQYRQDYLRPNVCNQPTKMIGTNNTDILNRKQNQHSLHFPNQLSKCSCNDPQSHYNPCPIGVLCTADVN
jgi:hypothetical protein